MNGQYNAEMILRSIIIHYKRTEKDEKTTTITDIIVIHLFLSSRCTSLMTNCIYSLILRQNRL